MATDKETITPDAMADSQGTENEQDTGADTSLTNMGVTGLNGNDQQRQRDQEQQEPIPILQQFHTSLIEDQSAGVVRGIPEDYADFEYSIKDEGYRRRFHNYLLAEQVKGNVMGIPRDLKDFTNEFAGDVVVPDMDEDVNSNADQIADAAVKSTIDLSLLDAPGLSTDMMEAMQSSERVSKSMIDSIASAGKTLRSHLKKVEDHRRGLVNTDFLGFTYNDDQELEYIDQLKDTSNDLKGQLFQAYSTLTNERNRLQQQQSQLEETFNVPDPQGGYSGMNPVAMAGHKRVPDENRQAYDDLQSRIDEIDEKIDEVQPSGMDRVRHSANQFLKSFTGELPAGFFEGIAVLSSATNKMLKVVGEKTPVQGKGIEAVRRLMEGEPGKYDEVKELATWQIARTIREVADDQFPTDPTMQDEFVETMLPAAFGSFGAFGGAGFGARALRMSAGAVAGTAAGTGGMGQSYAMAKAYGASEEDAQLAGQWGFVPGVIQVLPVMRMLDRFDRAAGGQLKRSMREVFKEGLAGSLEEGIVESAGQAGFEVIADQIYRKEPELLKSMGKIGEAGGAGAIAGFIANVITGGAARGMARQQRQLSIDQANEQGPTEPTDAGGEGTTGDTEVDLDGPGIEWDDSAAPDVQVQEINEQLQTLESVRDMMAEQGESTEEFDKIIKAGYNEISRLESGVEQDQLETLDAEQGRPDPQPSIAGLLESNASSLTESQSEQLNQTQATQQELATRGTIREAMGTRVNYNGYRGRLGQDSEGNVVVETEDGLTVEVADTQKDIDMELGDVGIERTFASMREFRYDSQADNFVMEMPGRDGEPITGRFEYVRTNTNDAGEPVSVTMTNEAGQERTFRSPEAVEDVIWGQFFSEGTDMVALDREFRRFLEAESSDDSDSDGPEAGAAGAAVTIEQPEITLDDGDARLDPVFAAFDGNGTLTEQEQTDALEWANDKLSEVAESNPDNADELISTLEQFELEVLNYGNQQTTPDMGDGSPDIDQASVSESTPGEAQPATGQTDVGGSESAPTTGSAADATTGTTSGVQPDTGGAEQGGTEGGINTSIGGDPVEFKGGYIAYSPLSPTTPGSELLPEAAYGAQGYNIRVSGETFISGNVYGADFPGQPSQRNLGDVFMLNVEEKGNGTGTSLMLDALRLMKQNGVDQVKFTVPSSEGRPFNQTLVDKGYITEVEVAESGTTKYQINDSVLESTEGAEAEQPTATVNSAKENALVTEPQTVWGPDYVFTESQLDQFIGEIKNGNTATEVVNSGRIEFKKAKEGENAIVAKEGEYRFLPSELQNFASIINQTNEPTSPSSDQPEQFADDVEQRVIRVDVGRGKTGKAKSGTPRFMTRDTDAEQKLEAGIRKVYDAMDDPVPWEEFLATSRKSIMEGLVTEDVGLVVVDMGDQPNLYLWNDAKLPQLGPRTLQRMEIQNDLQQGRNVPDDVLSQFPDAASEMGTSESTALDVQGGEYSMWIDDAGDIHFYNKSKGREVGPTSKYFNDAFIEFTVRRWEIIPNTPIQEIAPTEAIEAANGDFAELVNDHSEHLYDFADAIQDRINKGQHKDAASDGRKEITDDFLSGQVTLSHDDVRSFRPDAWADFPILRMKSTRDAPTDPALIADRINDKWNTDLTESDVVDLFIDAHTGDVKTGDFTDPLTQSLADRASDLIGQEYTRDMHNQLLEAIDARRGDVTVEDVQDAQRLIDHESFDATLMFDENGNLIVDQAAQQIADLAAQDAEFEAYNQGELSPEMIQELQNENTKDIPARIPTSESSATNSPATGENEGTTPAQREVAKQIAAAQTEVQRANNARSAKIKELEETLQDDARDLFGNKKPSEQSAMFDIQADPNQIPVALKPFNDRLQRAQDELQRLYDKRDSLQPSNEPDIFQQGGLEQRAGELRSELNTLLNEYDRLSGGGLRSGIDPRLVAKAAQIIAKGTQLGFVRFQQFATYVADNYGADFWRKAFDSFKAAYVARVRKNGNPNNEDLDAIQASTAEDWTGEGGQEGDGQAEPTITDEGPTETGDSASTNESVEQELNSPDKGYNVPGAPDGLFTAGRDYTPAQKAAIERGKFGAKEDPTPFMERMKQAKYLASAKIRQGVFDQFNSLDRILGDQKAWMMAQLSQATTGALEATIDFGRPFIQDGAINVDVTKKGFKDVLEPLGIELDDWFRWLAGNRSYQIKQEDARRLAEWEESGQEGPKPKSRESLFSDEDIQALRELNEGTMEDGRSRSEVYETARQEFEEINNAVVDIAVQTGLVNAEQAQDWAEQGFYVPFYRMVDDQTRGPRVFKDDLAKQTAFKKLKGSDIPLDDLLGNTIMNWNHLFAAAMRNQAAGKALDTATDIGMAEEVVEAAASKDAIWVRRDGDKVFYEFEDSPQALLVMDSLLSLNYDGLNNFAMKLMRKFKRALTIGVTVNPEFRIANLIRDTVHSAAVVPVSVNLAKNVSEGFRMTKRGSQSQASMIAGGGAFGDSGYIHGTDPEYLRRVINKGLGRDTVLDTRARVQKMWDAYQDFGARMENVNRAAAFAETLRNGGSLLDANFQSRDVLDFSRTGSFGAVRAITQVVPFLNARMQGMDKMYRAMEDPNQRKQFATVVGVYSLASAALYLMMKDDEDFQEAEQWERDAYHLFKIPGSDIMYRMPKPFEVGFIGTMAERLTEQAVDDTVHGELFAERLVHGLTETLSFNPMPQQFMPVMELIANKSFFTDRPIENQGMQRLSPEMRRRAWTSQTAIGASMAMDKILWDDVVLSPVQIEHLVNGYLGWLGGTTLAATDMLIARPLAQSPTRPARRISDYPIIGRFAREGESRNSKYITNYYENLNEITQAWSDIRQYREMGQLDKAENVAEEARNILQYRTGYNRVQRRLSELNGQIEQVYMDQDLSANEKRQQIDMITSEKKRLAREAVMATETGGDNQ